MAVLFRDNNKSKWDKIMKSKYKDENHLQEILYNDPELIPIVEMGEKYEPLLVVVRELGLPGSGNTDLVGVDKNGAISIIETKLANNPEVKRKVIGQIFEYASFLWNRSYKEFDEMIRSRSGKSLIDAMAELVDDKDWSEEEFRDNVENNLQKGDFSLFIVVDEMNDELKRIIEFINSRAGSDLELYALSLSYFEKDGKELLLPKIFGYAPVVRTRRSSRNIWDEESFFKKAEGFLGEKDFNVLKSIYDFVIKSKEKIKWGGGIKPTFNISVNTNIMTITSATIFADSKGWFHLGSIASKIDKKLAQDYADRFMELGIIPPVDPNKEIEHYHPTFDLTSLNPDQIESFKKTLSELCSDLKEF